MIDTTAADIPDNTTRYPCPVCKTGHLLFVNKAASSLLPNTGATQSWTCERFPVCLFSTHGQNGVPHGVYHCSKCGRPLNYIETLDVPVWTCSGWFEKPPCKSEYEDLKRKPLGLADDTPGPLKDTVHDA